MNFNFCWLCGKLFAKWEDTMGAGCHGVFPLSQHLKKNTGKSMLAKWELGTGKVQVENKRI